HAGRHSEQHSSSPTAVAMNRDRTLVASADRLGEIHVWEAATGRRQSRKLTGEGRAFYKVAFDATGRRLAFGTVPYGTGTFDFNHYSHPERTFDLNDRRIIDGT